MTEQEEIKEGLEKLILKWEEDSPDAGYGYELDIWIPELIDFLHSRGCVIKVEGELPKDKDFTRTGGCFSDSEKETHAFDTGYFASQQDMLNNNWRCVESILGKDSPV